ncbi:unnamed protein product [Brachionus calyciflorus]|uniref:Uncharacterized protein n=1 Tax=Brachionus calyciflorus TaxID=104777 RepID=A0A813M4E4_9BILA|nr:unnamed protein product [Brachionus calyciflorus]
MIINIKNLGIFILFIVGKCDSRVINSSQCAQSSRIIQENFKTNSKKIYFTNFDDYDQIKLECINMTDEKYSIGILKFHSNFKTELKSNFNFDIKGIKYSSFPSISLYNINKFNYNSRNFLKSKVIFSIYYSFFNFNEQKCDLNQTNKFTLFKNIYILQLFQVKFTQSICPLVFFNLSLEQFGIKYITNTIILSNFILFKQKKLELNFELNQLLFYVFRIELSNRTFDTNVFLNVTRVKFVGKLNSIDGLLLTKLKRLENLTFNIVNLISINFNWIKTLNVNLDKKIKIVIQEIYWSDYKFPIKDFCFFKDFPTYKNIIWTLKDPKIFVNCSCVLFWIYGYNRSSEICENVHDYKTCDFSSILNKCIDYNPRKFVFIQKEYLLNQDFEKTKDFNFLGSWVKQVIQFVVPLACITGLFINILNVLVVLKTLEILKIKKESKNCLIYKLMLYNSINNGLYCFVMLFHVINMCPIFNGMYCFEAGQTVYAQYYEILMVDFFGSCLKSHTNILSMIISLVRYVMLDKESKISHFIIRIKKFKNLFLKCLFFIIFYFLIFLTNIDKLNQSVINYKTDEWWDPEYFNIPTKNWFRKSVFFENTGFFTGVNVNYYIFIFNSIFNNIIIWSILLTSDMFLLVKFKSFINQSKKLQQNMNNHITIKRKSQEYHHKKVLMTFTIWLNTSVLLFLRVLDFLSSISLIATNALDQFCRFRGKICDDLLEFSFIFSILSCSYLTVVYYTLNKPFRKNFKLFFKFKSIIPNENSTVIQS